MEPQITSNVFCVDTRGVSEVDTTIFFISGNPGLISYYHTFLSLLSQNLADTASNSTDEKSEGLNTPSSYQIYGCSLGGFEVEADSQKLRASLLSRPPCGHSSQHDSKGAGRVKGLYDLDDQIQFVREKLIGLMCANAAACGDISRRQKVILVGHSVGAYIAMEILRHHRESSSESYLSSNCSIKVPRGVEFDIIGAVMLFPAVMNIAHSPSGQKLTVGGSILDLISFESLISQCHSELIIDRNYYPLSHS